MERIVKNNLPLNFCESEEARRYMKLDPICVETLCRSLRKVTRAVEVKLAAEMPDQFGVIIDGWTLRPVIRQETRWSSTFMMLDRYFKLLEFVKDDADLEDALPTRTENPDLKALHAELTNVESVTKALQSTKVSMADTRLLFDGLIPLRASFAKYLGERAEIVYAADFEAACVKIQEGRAHQLSRAQKAAVSQLAVREAPAIGATSDGAQAAAKRRKTTGSSGDEEESFVGRLKSARKAMRGKTLYPLVAAIPPTSNIVERLFSVARLALGLEHHNLLPITFEAAILFLRLSDGYWDVCTVDASC
ncbi:hypothetical protein PC128_g20814 [Phytophthora cactorum]|nr:hypothetical protein PC120_g19052 [Phytophthora cactorum]KAG3048515.1 hypothetical protein PC121_g19436 [Phytophthora cactorum]KAG3161405.1 hypothetical protein PC128_g20814 [Phytophthora cactorum]KAG4044878.1 hypothetical protein PC123_g19704 [Phytophthora cactorum]